VGTLTLIQYRRTVHGDAEIGWPDDEVAEDGVRWAASCASVKPVHAVAWARPCSNPTHSAFMNNGIVSATIVNAVATAIQMSPTRLRVLRTGAS